MSWIIIIVLLAFVIFGYFIINKLDKFLASSDTFQKSHPEPEKAETKTALIFGNQDLSEEIAEILEKADISYAKITHFNELDRSSSYKYLFAVDESDFENLMICSFCERIMGIEKRISICNCLDNMKIFKENHIPFLCGYSISALALASELIPSLQEAGGLLDV